MAYFGRSLTLGKLINENLGKKGPGVFALPGLVKLKVVHKPATPARKGHQARANVQGQARAQGCQGRAFQGTQRHGQINLAAKTTANCLWRCSN